MKSWVPWIWLMCRGMSSASSFPGIRITGADADGDADMHLAETGQAAFRGAGVSRAALPRSRSRGAALLKWRSILPQFTLHTAESCHLVLLLIQIIARL